MRSARICARSYCACCVSQLSALLPKTLDNRTAISGEIPRFSFTNSDSVVRVSPSPAAASVIVRPSASMHCRSTKPPRCGGFFIAMVHSSSTVIDIINLQGFPVGKAENDPPFARTLSRPMNLCPPTNVLLFDPLRRFLQRRTSAAGRSMASRGFSLIAPGLNQHICRNAEFVMQFADHIKGQRALTPQYLVDPRALADYSDQGAGIFPFLFEPEFDGFHRIRKFHGIVFALIGFDQRCEDIHLVAFGRALR